MAPLVAFRCSLITYNYCSLLYVAENKLVVVVVMMVIMMTMTTTTTAAMTATTMTV